MAQRQHARPKRPVDRVQEDCFSLGHINQGVLPKELTLLPASTGGEHFVDPGTCSVAKAIKLGCENNSPDGRGNKVRDQDAG